jgi:uncharacterized C2H2 Zn-finger protein
MGRKMIKFGEKERKWLEEHVTDLEPEELPFENDKIYNTNLTVCWPKPCEVSNMGVFSEIVDSASFNRIVGNLDNWPTILHRSTLYREWILPHAVLLFGKSWFDKYKWRISIRLGNPLPLFLTEERIHARETGIPLENSFSGRMRVAQISICVERALDKYLNGGGKIDLESSKQPGGYITQAIKNELVRDIANNHGYRLKIVRTCPYCLGIRKDIYGNYIGLSTDGRFYVCSRCSEVANNLREYIKNMNQFDSMAGLLNKRYNDVSVFQRMDPVTCVCPSDKCPGRFVPLNAVSDHKWWDSPEGIEAKKCLSSYRTLKGTKRFKQFPDVLLNIPLRCPYCGVEFTPSKAMATQSGYHGKSGWGTGIPTIVVWCKQSSESLERKLTVSNNMIEDTYERIAAEQRVSVLVGELEKHIAKSIKCVTVPSIISQCFYKGVIKWMMEHNLDASRYFFEWSTDKKNSKQETQVTRGNDRPIHQSILYYWMSEISKSVSETKATRSGIRSMNNIKWLCKPPRYPEGPEVTFTSTVEIGLSIPSNIGVKSKKGNRARIVWVLSLHKDGDNVDLTKFIRYCGWHSIMVSSDSDLKVGDKVQVTVLIMPGHHCHAPIQRIIRLRTVLLFPIVERIRDEERGMDRDMVFWNRWKKEVDLARKAIGVG